MPPLSSSRLRLVGWLAALLMAVKPARALVRFNDGLDQIFVTGTAAYGYNSNIFSSKHGDGDFTTNYSLLVEYLRRDGYIGVNASVGWNLGRFSKFSSQNFADPTLSLEFDKDSTGRLKGELQFSAARQSTADSAANIRTNSWNYAANLNWKYKVIERYTLSGGFGYGLTQYQPGRGLANLSSYVAKLDVYYNYSSERDLFAGYQLRLSDTSADARNTDSDFHVGVSGRIVSKLTGSLQLGYQFRTSDAQPGPPVIPASSFNSISIQSSLNWAYSRRIKFVGQVKKDFSTTSTNVSTDATEANVQGEYSYNAKLSAFGTAGAGETQFLGALGAGRTDYNFSWGTGVNFTYNDHFKAVLAYAYLQNWSNVSDSNFESRSFTLTITSRW